MSKSSKTKLSKTKLSKNKSLFKLSKKKKLVNIDSELISIVKETSSDFNKLSNKIVNTLYLKLNKKFTKNKIQDFLILYFKNTTNNKFLNKIQRGGNDENHQLNLVGRVKDNIILSIIILGGFILLLYNVLYKKDNELDTDDKIIKLVKIMEINNCKKILLNGHGASALFHKFYMESIRFKWIHNFITVPKNMYIFNLNKIGCDLEYVPIMESSDKIILEESIKRNTFIHPLDITYGNNDISQYWKLFLPGDEIENIHISYDDEQGTDGVYILNDDDNFVNESMYNIITHKDKTIESKKNNQLQSLLNHIENLKTQINITKPIILFICSCHVIPNEYNNNKSDLFQKHEFKKYIDNLDKINNIGLTNFKNLREYYDHPRILRSHRDLDVSFGSPNNGWLQYNK